MKILQLDLDNMTYEPIKPEASVYEDTEEKKVSIDNTVAILVSVEKGDTEETAKAAMADTLAFMEKQKMKKLVIYPFAHLSNSLAEPKDAMEILQKMAKEVPSSIEVKKAPFGWNKRLSISIKGHPLAEMTKSYDSAGKGVKT